MLTDEQLKECEEATRNLKRFKANEGKPYVFISYKMIIGMLF